MRRLTQLTLDRGNLRTLLILAACLFGRPDAVSVSVAFVVLVPGALIHLWAKGCLHQNEILTTSGPYAYTRNPFYVANLVIDASFCVAARSVIIAAVYLVAFAIVYHATIGKEERRLEKLFGESFRRYRQRVPRFFPYRGRVAAVDPSEPFSWTNPNIARGREVARLVRFAGVPVLIWLAFEARRILWGGGAVLTRDAPMIATAAAGLVVIKLVERMLVYRMKRGAHLPAAFRHPATRGAALIVFAAVALLVRAWEAAPGGMALHVGLVVFFAMFLALAFLPLPFWSRPGLCRIAEAGACLVGGFVSRLPWWGLVGFGLFVILAVDEAGTGPSRAGVYTDARLWRRRIYSLALIFAFVILGGVKG